MPISRTDPLLYEDEDHSIGFYVDGYVMGFTVEQISATLVAVGVASKVGTVAKIVMASTSTGKQVLNGVDTAGKAVHGLKTLSVNFAMNSAKKVLWTEDLTRAATKMADAVSKLPYPYASGKTVGNIIREYVDRLDIIQQELALIGKPLDDFGVKAQAQLAKVLDHDFGFYPGDDAMRGDIRLYQKLLVGDVDRTDDLMQLFITTDGELAASELQTSLESFKITTDKLGDIGAQFPLFKVANIDDIQPELYRIYGSQAKVRSTGESVVDYVKREHKLPPPSELEPTDATTPPYGGHFLGMDKAATPDATTQLYQIDSTFKNDCKLRLTVDSSSVSGDCIVPYSANRNSSVLATQLEPICRDFAVDSKTEKLLAGGGRQVVTYTQGRVTLIELWDDASSTWQVIPFD